MFPDGGLFLGPSHAIQVGSPLENILAMYREAGSLAEKVDDSIYLIDIEKKNENEVGHPYAGYFWRQTWAILYSLP